MSIYFTKIDEKTIRFNISYKKRAYNRRVKYEITGGSPKVLISSGTDTAGKNQAVINSYDYMNLPPNILVEAYTIAEQKEGDKWKVYKTNHTSIKLGNLGIKTSASATSYDSGSLTVKVLKHRPMTNYKINARITPQSGGTINKTFTMKSTNTTPPAFEQRFAFSGLKPGTKYTVAFDIYNTWKGKDYFGGTFNPGSFTTPTLSSYLSTVAVDRVEIEGLSHTAKVYWKIASAKANSYYKLFYLKANGTEVAVGGDLTAVPASGYSTVTVAPEDIATSRDVTFFVRAYSKQTNVNNYNDSNKVSEYMYAAFEWDFAKTQGGQAMITADEWNRCKEWIGVKVPAFTETDAYSHITTPGESVTNEEIQVVLDALGIDQTINDGTIITAGLYNQIASAINS